MIESTIRNNSGRMLVKEFQSRYFTDIGRSGCQAPGISLASENFQSLYFTKK